MTIEINENKKEKKVYPWIGYYKNFPNLIVLFTSPNSGVCLGSSHRSDISKYSNLWMEYDYLPFNGEITLKNS